MSAPLHVMAAVIRSPAGRVLIARRPEDKDQGGLWEFPGGKREPGETRTAALARELREELGIEVRQARPLIQVRHAYPNKTVLLDVWQVTAFDGEAQGLEGQPVRWVWPDELPDYRFPAANYPIISAARLPERYLITPDEPNPELLLERVEQALAAGITLIQLRAPQLSEAEYRCLAQRVLTRCLHPERLMFKGPLAWADEFPSVGWHLTARQLHQLPVGARPLAAHRWLAASCHSAAELDKALALGVDFVTLSPIQPTQTHPEAQPLGWEKAQQLIADFPRPVYLLGGMKTEDVPRAFEIGAQGVAGIRGILTMLFNGENL
ncbi:8-oxo-dGTP diphosphatase [Azomonas agilis]|uniref:8-oxo-dGTP diphosphatase n=1 Tax=Azomonas agilis TaxID=116849 RepID=A0A562J357_9GAMM|nr:Nudix family hydrolase [Azomonas agilis]TWH77254.1 8-oxo-dGTP diphosphatase [Azomonas agilis]